MADDNQSADADTEDRVEYAWASQTPHTRIAGTPKAIIYAGRLDDGVQQNDTSYGVVYEEPEVVEGSLWANTERGEGETMADAVDEDTPRPTDYRIADLDDDRSVNTTDINGETFLTTGEEGPSSYEQVDEVEEDAIIVWYNGMAGERLGRTLDFNGRPFARWTDDGYLVKGLMQAAEGWRGADSSVRSDLKDEGKAPRVVRAPILRQQVEETYDDEGNVESATLLDEPADQRVLVDLSRFMGGRGYEVHVFDADDFEESFGSPDAEIPRNDAGYVDDVDSAFDMPYSPVADDVLEQAEYGMHMYTGDGWQSEPENWSPQSTASVGSFGVSADAGSDDEGGLSASQEQFVREVADELKGTGLTPEEAFDGGLEGLIGKYSDQFDRVPDADDIREEVYARVGHLDADALEA